MVLKMICFTELLAKPPHQGRAPQGRGFSRPGQGKAFPVLFKKQMFVEQPSPRSCNAIACNRSDCYTCFAQKTSFSTATHSCYLLVVLKMICFTELPAKPPHQGRAPQGRGFSRLTHRFVGPCRSTPFTPQRTSTSSRPA